MTNLTQYPAPIHKSPFPGFKEIAVRTVIIAATIYLLITLRHFGLIT
jgi:hypothetical protein